MEDNQFEKYMKLLRESYEKKPKNTLIEMEIILKKLHMITNQNSESILQSFSKAFKEISFFPVFIIICFIVSSLIGLFQIQNYEMYLFGEVFFFAGLGVGLFVPAFGLLFLMSHGGTGFCLMIGSLLSDFITSPIWSDNPVGLYFYFGIMIVILIGAVIISIVHNLSASVKKNRKIFYLIGILYLIILLMAGILPYIAPYIVQFHL